MPRLRPAPLFLIAALTLASWLVASNHCALGGMRALPKAAHAPHSCCDKGKPDAPAPTVQCCEKLSAPLPVAVVAPSGDLVICATLWLETPWEISGPAARESGTVLLLSTGPPGSLSFAELVLQRSLPVHAPPAALV